MGERRYSLRKLFVGRGWYDLVIWIVSLLVAASWVARAIATGNGWPTAIVLTTVVVLYAFVPWAKEMQRGRELRHLGQLTIDDRGVTRVLGDLREAVAWDDLIWVRIHTGSAGPAVENVDFALGGADGNGCLVPHELAAHSNLLAALRSRLPGLDEGQLTRAKGAAANSSFTIWTRPERGGRRPISPATLN